MQFFLMSIVFFSGIFLFAQEPYKLPPKEVIDILDAPPLPRALMSPAGDRALLAEYKNIPSIAELAQPLQRLAGLRITPDTNSRQQIVFYTGLILKTIQTGETKRISLPEGMKFGFPQWSHDGLWIAFPGYTESGVEIWAADTASGKARSITAPCVNAILGSGFVWMPDNRHLLVTLTVEERGNPPKAPQVPVGPNIQETAGKFIKAATYQDLLKNSYDEALFEFYATGQIVEVNVATGENRKIGKPGIYSEITPSPDGTYILVDRVKKPFSYSVPYYRFAHSLEVWNRNGELVHLLADLPLADEIPMNGVPTGPRGVDWEPLKPSTLVWVEALDEGNPEKDVPFRDELVSLPAPFKGSPTKGIKLPHRLAGLNWLGIPGAALVTEYDWKKRWRTTYLIHTDQSPITLQKIFDLSARDQYKDPGMIVSKTTPRGERIAVQDKDWIYLSGRGSSPQGDRPFLDQMNLKTMKKKRLFQCGETSYEFFIGFIGNSRNLAVISYESKTEPPNYYLVNLKTKKRQPLTDFKDPAPQLTGMTKDLIKFKREDGVELSGTLYLPPDYKEGERLPVVIWAYPLEYSDASTAGQVRGSPNRFTFFRGPSQLFFVTQGYAVLDNAQMPVIGDPKTMNDTFVRQIVANAKAAIDKLDSMGVGDPARVGVGGHSYGAFMTANLLAHCDLFAAGIARSGAYNRTLTPFGFQSERRTLWEALETYIRMSPFMHADKINEPILLIHGEADNNSGTFPIQSERLFAALKGFGGTARLVLLPHESHGYAARESVLHVLAEMFEWFDKNVKNKK